MAWIKGLQNYDLETLHLLDAWVNEARRLFRDKIVEKEGAQYFEHLLESHLEKWNFTEPESLRYFTSFLSATESGTNRCFISMEQIGRAHV